LVLVEVVIMIRLDLVKNYAPIPVWNKFVDHLRSQLSEYTAVTDNHVNTALAEYRAVYYMEEVGNLFESDVLHWIEFEDQELYTWFMLRWS
jgi:hypothetical protein